MNHDVYLKPPKEAEALKLWKSNMTVYDPCHAPLAWYISVKKCKTSVKKSKFDDSIFYKYNNNKLERLICRHVHDFF